MGRLVRKLPGLCRVFLVSGVVVAYSSAIGCGPVMDNNNDVSFGLTDSTRKESMEMKEALRELDIFMDSSKSGQENNRE